MSRTLVVILSLAFVTAVELCLERRIPSNHSESAASHGGGEAPPITKAAGASLAAVGFQQATPQTHNPRPNQVAAGPGNPTAATAPSLTAENLRGALPVAEGGEIAFARFHDWIAKRLNAASVDVASADAEGIDLARKRREEMWDLIQAHPDRALQLALPENIRSILPASILSYVEERVSGQGDLEVLCALPAPDAPTSVHPLRRYVVIGDRRFSAFVHGRRLNDPTLRGVSLEGIAIDGAMAVEDRPVAEVGEGGGSIFAASTATEGLKRLLFLRVDFSDLAGEPFTTNRAADLTRELHRFYQENSFGRAGFVEIGRGSAVTPVFRMPRTAADYGSKDDSSDLRNDARRIAREAGYVLTNYDYDVTCMRNVPGFAWSGLGFVGSPGAWIRGTSAAGVAAHELGHNFGLNHANFWDTGGESIIGPGEDIEYGDKFDTMGAPNAGNFHFNARYKRLLDWLQDGEFTVATTNGVYRIFAQDQTNRVAGSRGLQVFSNARTNYWLEFRQRFTSNRWLSNGALLRWAGRDNASSILLDTTPGSAGEKDDSAVVIGRTFSDAETGVHLTPLSKGGANPAWLDVAVHRGAFAENHPPTATLSASGALGTTTTTFEFRAEATDPDGDSLAYFWEFSDDTISTNTPTVSHRWSAVGEYLVQCTVSDLKGGVARHSAIVRIGLPSTFRLSGRVIADGEPVSGARVRAAKGREAITDSDGTFTITQITNGTYTLTAVLNGTRFTTVGFTNPVRVVTDRDGLDFALAEVSTGKAVTLVAAGSAWRYWDQANAAGPDWMDIGFDDASWNLGPAILGYGGDRETTVIDFGTDATRKHVTTWFRRSVILDGSSQLSNVVIGLLRDDGAVVYLNGKELFRDNMPPGVVSEQSLAANVVGGADEGTYFEHEIDPSQFVAGTNVLAVEVHQSTANSSDLAFDLRLTADVLQTVESGVKLVRPSEGDTFRAPARIVLSAAFGEVPGAPLGEIAFFIDGEPLGTVARAPFTITWNEAPAGEHVLLAEARLNNGTSVQSSPVRVMVEDPDLTPVLIPRGAPWRYLDDGVGPDAAWTGRAFDDAGWKEGPARLGFGEDGELTVVASGPDATHRPITTWFRRAFDVTDAASIKSLLCRLQRDDGAVVYLNGEEIFRVGLVPGPVTPSLRAQADLNDEAEQVFIERSLTTTGLVEGRNVIAVEVHQFNSSSPDLGFDFELTAQRVIDTTPPRLEWRRSGEQLVLTWAARLDIWRLETRPALTGDVDWEPVAGSVVPLLDHYEHVVEPDNATAFFRLVR